MQMLLVDQPVEVQKPVLFILFCLRCYGLQ